MLPTPDAFQNERVPDAFRTAAKQAEYSQMPETINIDGKILTGQSWCFRGELDAPPNETEIEFVRDGVLYLAGARIFRPRNGKTPVRITFISARM